MNPRSERRHRGWLAGLLYLAAVARVGAASAETATPPATPARPAESESPITSAKRDFEAIKAARDPSQAGTNRGGPKLTLPEFQPGPGPTVLRANPGGSEKQRPAGTRSPTWLLDAMEKEAKQAKASSDPRAGPRRERNSENAKAFDAEGPAADRPGERETRETAEAAATAEARAETATEDRRPPPENPFDRFLAGWMTPADYALLRGTVNADTSGRAGGNTEAVANAGGLSGDLAAAGIAAEGEAGRALGAAVGDLKLSSAPRENPFLQQFEALELRQVREAGTLAGPALPPPGPAAAAFAPPAPLPPAARPVIPEFARPDRDEKQFRQLKRF